MKNEQENAREELRQLREKGQLTEAIYRQLLAQLDIAAQAQSGELSLTKSKVEGSTITGTVAAGGDVAGRDIVRNVYYGKPTDDPVAALHIYRRVLVQSSGQLPLRGVDIGASSPTSKQTAMRLAQVYVALNTTAQIQVPASEKQKRRRQPTLEEPQERKPLTALAAAMQSRQLVLLGHPGSGKSTFVNHLAYCLAQHQLEPTEGWMGRLPQWPIKEQNCLPIIVILRDFARWLPQPMPHRVTEKQLWDFIAKRLDDQNLKFAADGVQAALENGQALLLLDGLDEVPTSEQRAFVRDAVDAFVRRYPGNRYLITCRVLSYQKPTSAKMDDLRLSDDLFPSFELALFDAGQIEQFIEAWYAELVQVEKVEGQEATRLARQLRQIIKRPDLWQLAVNPLLLTVIALVNTHTRLPDKRALLYRETIDMLLWQWDQVSKQADVTPLHQLLDEADRNVVDLKRVLGELAFKAHQQADGEVKLADIGAMSLYRALAAQNNDDLGWAQQMVNLMKYRAGLLLERAPDVFTFPHRTFQEYLAGTHLAKQDFAVAAARLAQNGTSWREVILLAVGYLVYVLEDFSKPLTLVAELCPGQVEESGSGWMKVWLAGDVLLEMGVKRAQDSSLGREMVARVQERLVALVTSSQLTPRERVAAADTLAKIGDPRPGVCDLEPDLIPIADGAFLMGEGRDEIELKAFAIARYPVTNAQYRRFIVDGGYTEKWRHCWTVEGWQESVKRSWQEPRYWDDVQFNQANQPVAGVSWHEAVAYANWLREKTGRPYRLPTEAEWERAARGQDAREYPWGNEWQEGAANSEELGMERTSAVGCFGDGAAACGAQDMSGNVWEWCQTRWQDENGNEYVLPYQAGDGREDLSGNWKAYRVFRGGAYNNDQSPLGCAFRYWFNPDVRVVDVGFRVCVSPFSLFSDL
ncbi:MAG: SUMF1/EgtB/PvdO family nonheme iron enzyme [Chloroflexi bacterium]|nr:SUMF1/EgtB/PvdO family nonheme iron enzyme [Chloroflexota bacterium]